MLLIPFTRAVILCLLITTVTVFLMGIARIHMFILSVLSGGMWFALGIFEREFSKVINGGEDEQEKSISANKRAPSVSTAKRED